VVYHLKEWVQGNHKVSRKADDDKGGTMRLGGQRCQLREGSLAKNIYGQGEITERHRHRYEFNPGYVERLEPSGLQLTGQSVLDSLVEIIELPNHPWFFACQYHPEFTSNPRDGHPLFTSFITAARNHHQGGEVTAEALATGAA
ncbi:MAG TPA: CTP synthetase, partial [candidate division Zixibacteria bacterium]|nr:CTP synthetase [candidate division Zixibacteria bacterium]